MALCRRSLHVRSWGLTTAIFAWRPASRFGLAPSAPVNVLRVRYPPTVAPGERGLEPSTFRDLHVSLRVSADASHARCRSTTAERYVVPERFGPDVPLRNAVSQRLSHPVCARCVPGDF